ncbi:guanine nucleotide exchange protein smcr8b [Nothobranchius furzeri]|uniref:Smith-Magenis syndrome chromosomal region candidate gene 8 protein-like protein n=1 Tax=Nothobranchius furzeri TaxID=105023 RepID=A0A1A8AUQ7_NOTFU|nr:guanine nucleotide exchange protein smcr8b [Nothobranchius furzeri]KAF7223555.1 Smith-Magenis syndrome chromosomal region candidate gene 8 protein-like protein [Nothobranchius furzeri]
MIGSPDLLPFTGSEGFEEERAKQEAWSLPEEFSVPLGPSAQPWSSRAQFHRDFILVAEFSEQVGPRPVLTIPNEQKVIGSFDLNHFSVRIMSVDYQASGPGHTPPSSPGPRLSFSEDSRVMLGDSAEDAFAYVQHLTLYDLEARGMVRPFCIAYVCSDQVKLMENFSELSTGFSQASDSLKTGNRQAFSTELQRKLQELEFRRLTLLQNKELQEVKDESAEGKPEELDVLEYSILNHRELLRQVTSYPNRKLQQPDFLPYDPADSLTDLTALQPPEPCSYLPTSSSSSSPSSYRSENLLKPLEELCNSYFFSLMKEQLVDTERRLRGDRSVLRTCHVTHSLSRRLKLTNFLFELWSPREAEEEEGERAEMEAQGVSGSKTEVQSERQSAEVLISCLEEIPIKLVAEKADFSAAAEMTGSMSSGDSIEVLGTEKSYQTQRVIAETSTGTADVCVRCAAIDAGVRRVRDYAKRANSEDSIEVLSTSESIFPDDLTAITEEEAEHHPLTNGFKDEEELANGWKSDELPPERMKMTWATSENERDDPVNKGESLGEPAADVDDSVTKRIKDIQEDVAPEKAHEPSEGVDLFPRRLRLFSQLHVKLAPPTPVAEMGRRSPPCPPLRLLSVDEMSDCSSFTGSSDTFSPTQGNHSSTQLGRRRRKAGLRALRFIKHHSFSQHAIFCLLSGRPLVVVGGDESLVRKQVDGLSLFLPSPGSDGSAVMPCLTTPLQLSDLLTWRLIGIQRSSSSLSSTILLSVTRYSRYLALLDLDQKTLQSPTYSGSLLSQLAEPHTGFRGGLTYLLHLESCLAALASKALLHTLLAGGVGTERDCLHAQGSFSSECDYRVMHHLSDLIKQRHAGRGPPFLKFSYCSVQLHKNTFAT